ncbi:MAG: sensor histidine kinase [Gammaproteobacteria bacterium]
MLNNLLSNAIKYSHQGSTVRIGLETTPDTLRITVRDQGEGIAEEDIPGLFQPFARASKQGTSGERSTGLSLAIVRRIIEGHGGAYTWNARWGRGRRSPLRCHAGQKRDVRSCRQRRGAVESGNGNWKDLEREGKGDERRTCPAPLRGGQDRACRAGDRRP